MFPYIGEAHVHVNIENRHREAEAHRRHRPLREARRGLQHRICGGCGSLLIRAGQRLLAAADYPHTEPERRMA